MIEAISIYFLPESEHPAVGSCPSRLTNRPSKKNVPCARDGRSEGNDTIRSLL
jgi:hypothetical protein